MSNESGSLSEREVAAVESALLQLAPSAARFDANRFFFRAGQESVRFGRWFWPGTSVVLVLAVCTLGTLLVLKPSPEVIEKVVYVPVPVNEPAQAPPPPDTPATTPANPAPPSVESAREPRWVLARSQKLESADYLRLRDRVLRFGVESMPLPPALLDNDVSQRPLNVADLLADETSYK